MYYAVADGYKIGVFRTWEECSRYVSGYSCAIYKKFSTLKEAELFIERHSPLIKESQIKEEKFDAIAYVDGSYNNSSKEYGYACILLHDKKEFIISGKGNDSDLVISCNVAGELEGAIRAIEKAILLKCKNIKIYYDFEGIEKWATGQWKAKNENSRRYKTYIDLFKKEININFQHVKGHSGNVNNNRVDKLSRKACH